jgi:hypothetical protein
MIVLAVYLVVQTDEVSAIATKKPQFGHMGFESVGFILE